LTTKKPIKAYRGVAVELPEKQGLKPEDGLYEVLLQSRCSGTSRKTRIETKYQCEHQDH